MSEIQPAFDSSPLTNGDTFQHARYKDVTVTTYRTESGRVGFTIRGTNTKHVRAVEKEMLAIVKQSGAKVGKRTEAIVNG